MNNQRRKNSSLTFSVAKIANAFVLARQNELLQNTELRKIYEKPTNKKRGCLYSPQCFSVNNSMELSVILNIVTQRLTKESQKCSEKESCYFLP